MISTGFFICHEALKQLFPARAPINKSAEILPLKTAYGEKFIRSFEFVCDNMDKFVSFVNFF
ncbi:hypothetical protein BTA51_21680 [Hahella sp. CCB-MM4]|nr:hypothetical protein BTA51_21680 [Hahella sp. CCB-MM4]